MTILYILCALNFAAVAFVAWRIAPLFKMAADMRYRSKHVSSVVSFGPTIIEKNATHTFDVPVRVDFTGERLVIPSPIGPSFVVHDIEANGVSQFEDRSNAVPALAFSEQSIGVKLGMERVKKGGTIRLSISNVTGEPKTFSAALIGLIPRAQSAAAMTDLSPQEGAN